MAKELIVVLGAGYGGLRVVQKLKDLLAKDSDYGLILVNKHNFHMFMTQLHESATGTSDFEDVSVPICEILDGSGVEFIKGWVDRIDLEKKIVEIDNGVKNIHFRYLVVALGSEPEFYNIPGLKENSLSLRSLYSSLEIRRRIDNILKAASAHTRGPSRERLLTFVVGGGGLTGVEFAGELAHQLQRVANQYHISQDEYKIIMVEGSKELLPGLPQDLGKYTHQTLEEMGVEVITEDFIKEVTKNTLSLTSGRLIEYSLLVWAGGIKGNPVLEQSGFQTAIRGRVPVNQYLQYVNDPSIYLVGDNALVKDPKTSKPVLPTAQSALLQGEVAGHNIYADITEKEKIVYQPKSIGTLISIGRGKGLGEVSTFTFKGSAASWLKGIIPLKYRYSLGGFKMLTSLFSSKN